MLLEGEVAIVSGVGPGLGQANARALAREGATVVLAARNADYLAEVEARIEADGGRAVAVPTNLVEAEQVEALVARTVETCGRLDILVNNAFRMDVMQAFEAVDLVKWRKIFEVNVWGALGLTQACIPHLETAAAKFGDASIVFIISMSMRQIRALEGGYSASKAAIQTAAKTMAVELGPRGVRVNCVAPGWIGGPNVETFIQMDSAGRDVSPDVVRGEIEARIPLGMIPPQDDIANSVVFFASPWSRVITGQTLDVNGGEWIGYAPGTPRVAVVTGASAGIGRAIAIALGALGWPVAVGARRIEQLEETATLVKEAGGTPFAHTLDVCEPASIDEFLAATEATLGPVDVLVNNAGTAAPGALHEMSDETHAQIIATNLLGPILVSKRVASSLRERNATGDIVFISSDATVRPRPHLGTYGASKAGLEAYATTLAMESEDFPIRASIVRVGPTLTGFAEGWDMEQFAAIIPHWQRFGIQRHFNTMQPEDVARAVVTTVTAPPHMWIPLVEVQPQPPST